MDRLFKKRTISVKEARRDPSRQNSGDVAVHSPTATITAGPSSGGGGEGGKDKVLSLRRKKKGRKGTMESVNVNEGQGFAEGSRQSVASGISTVAPSLNMDFRSSLMMPGLEQRFSVLLPSLSAIPESSLRQLLEGQRARNGNDLGPTITVGEEKLLFAELHQMAHAHRRRQEEWERAPATDPTWSTVNLARWEHGAFEPSAGSPPVPPLPPQGRGVQSYMSGSSSTPNLSGAAGAGPGYEAPLSAMEFGGRGNGYGYDGMAMISPPPTSASFDSLATFGQNASGSGSGAGGVMSRERAMSRTKAYGFGGGARMQEDMYLRRTRKESGKDLGGSTSTTGRSVSGRSDESTERAELREGIMSPTSPTYDEPSWRSTERDVTGRSKLRDRAASPSESDRTATPTSAIPLSAARFTRHSPSSSLSLNLPPQPPAPTSPPPETPSPASFSDTLSPALSQGSGRSQGRRGQGRGAPRQRKSMMAGLSAAQMKRISMALVEIERELEAMGIHSPDLDALNMGAAHNAAEEDKEEMLDPDAPHMAADGREEEDEVFSRESRERAASMSKSDSGMSTGSSVFPYHVSPTTGSFTAAHARQASGGAGKGIPPSPKSANLAGQVLLSPTPTRLELPPPASAAISPSNTSRATLTAASATTSANRNPQSLIIQEGSRPQPVLTPTRTQPARHMPTSSTGSSSSIASAVPGYIPGQPRPVGAYRSDGSASSRSGTPTAADPNGTLSIARSRSGSSPSSSPTPVRTALGALVGIQATALERSQSVQQGMASPAMVPGTAHHRNASLNLPEGEGRRSTSPLVHRPPIRAGIEEEDEAAEDAGTDMGTPPDLVVPSHDEDEDITVHQIPGKYSVARSRSDAGEMKGGRARKGLAAATMAGESRASRDDSEERSNGLLDVGVDHRALRVVSHQAQVEGSEHSYAPSSQARAASVRSRSEVDRRSGSISGRSDGSCWHGSDGEKDDVATGAIESEGRGSDGEASGKALWEMTGLGVVEMREMQVRLVKRAKEEREALRSMGESPAMLMSPAMLDRGTDLPAVPGFSRAASPLVPTSTAQPSVGAPTPTGARAATPTAARATTPTSNVALMSPRSEAHFADRSGSSAAAMALADRRPAPAPPQTMSPAAQTPSDHDDIVKTPSSTGHTASPRAKVAVGDDPEVRRDFEARIAAATAALQRGPSIGGNAKLERKGTKRAAIKISSPKLVSSSSSISTTPLSPPTDALRSVSGGSGSERSSGPAHKLSLKWKKAFKRGPSVSSREVFTPPASESSLSAPGSNTPTPIAEMYAQTGSGSGLGSQLEEPIALSSSPAGGTGTGSGRKTPQPDLGGFRFPLSATPADAPGLYGLPSPPGTANPTSGLRQMMGKIRRGRSDEAGAQQQSGGGVAHLSRPSDAPAVAKFIAAGRALGMNEQLLNELLAAKGVGVDARAAAAPEPAISTSSAVPPELGGLASGSEAGHATAATSIRSIGSAALTGDSSAVSRASPSPVTPGVAVVHSLIPSGTQDQDKPKTEVVDDETLFDRREGLAGLVRALSKNKKRVPKEMKGQAAAEGVEAAAAERRRVVRRTLLMPDSGVGRESGSFTSRRSPRSPRSPRSFTSGGGQPESPAPSGSTPALGGRKPSIRRKPIALSKEDARLVEDSGSPVSHIRTLSDASARMMGASTGQSGVNGNVGLGFLGADAPEGGMIGRGSMDSARQGIEITEYDNGQMVWNVVDGLRGRMAIDEDDDEDAASADSEYTQTGTHSRQASFSLSHSRNASFASTGSDAGQQRRVSGADVVSPSPRNEFRAGTVPLALRSRDRAQDLRPKTNLYFTSPNDVADLIDQLSRDDGGSGKGRIDFSGSPFGSPPPVPSFPTAAEPTRGTQLPMEQEHRTPPQPSGHLGHDIVAGQFEDAPSPLAPARSPVNGPVPGLPTTPSMSHARTASAALANATATRRSPPAPINVGRANGRVPAGGWSPKRQVYLRQGFGKSPVHAQHGSSGTGMGSFSGSGSSAWAAGAGARNEVEPVMDSPGAQSYMSGSSAGTTPNRAVEDRLQALMDRLVRSGAAREG